MNGTLYGVGVGPGDPKLLTIKAIETIGHCQVVVAVDSGNGDKTALGIVAEYIKDKEILTCVSPMTRDEAILTKSHQKAAQDIIDYLNRGIDVCFVTLGDPSIYSTYMYIHRFVMNNGYDTRLIPGVTSFCAVAAELNVSLCEGSTPLHIIPASYDGLEQGLEFSGTKVLMKSGKSLQTVLALLKEKQMAEKSMMVERCGMDGQAIYRNIEEITNAPGYFSTIIVKE